MPDPSIYRLEKDISRMRWYRKGLIVASLGIMIGAPAGIIDTLAGGVIEHNRAVRLGKTVLACRNSGLPAEDARTTALHEWNNPEKIDEFIRKYYGTAE